MIPTLIRTLLYQFTLNLPEADCQKGAKNDNCNNLSPIQSYVLLSLQIKKVFRTQKKRNKLTNALKIASSPLSRIVLIRNNLFLMV